MYIAMISNCILDFRWNCKIVNTIFLLYYHPTMAKNNRKESITDLIDRYEMIICQSINAINFMIE